MVVLRDGLSFRNIRGGLWPVLLVFPLSVITGNLRYFDHSIALAGARSSTLLFFLLGFGWLILAILPKGLFVPLLRIAALISAGLMISLNIMPFGPGRVAVYLSLKFFNALSAACAFYLFCFMLNNVERMFGLALIQCYYGLYYTAGRTNPAFYFTAWGGAVSMAVYLAVVFFCRVKKQEITTEGDGKGSGVPIVLSLCLVHYMIMCMSNYIEWTENSVSSLAFGLGTFFSVGLVIIIQLLKSRGALYIWLLFLALTLLGLGALLYDTPLTFLSGSFAYGLGDGLGYIIIYYVSAGAIKLSKSLRMFRLYCLAAFVMFFIISGLFSVYFDYFETADRFLAFGVVLVLVSLSLLFMPLIQKKLFEADWTDGLYLRDMEEYSKRNSARYFARNSGPSFAQNLVKEGLNLTAREEEIFSMLLKGISPKEIAYTLKISYDTVNFHQKNLYRKLGIQSRSELFARYLPRPEEKN